VYFLIDTSRASLHGIMQAGRCRTAPLFSVPASVTHYYLSNDPTPFGTALSFMKIIVRKILSYKAGSCYPDRSSSQPDQKTVVLHIQDPNQNHLLAALLDADFERISPSLESVPLLLGDVLCESGGKLDYVYFPTTAIISIHYLLENGGSSEIAGVGNEGVLGVALFMGGSTTPSRAVVQTGGFGYRLPVRILMEEFNRAGSVMRLLLRYTQALLTHMSQTAVCNRHHTVEQQLCRWLLLTLDRLSGNELTMTQELISNMLGVRREGVTEAAGRLQGYRYISYRRGHITVLDRAGLERHVCECYGVVKKEFGRLLSDVRQRQPVTSASRAA
jgi:CRP-like cAMP-binding protein